MHAFAVTLSPAAAAEVAGPRVDEAAEPTYHQRSSGTGLRFRTTISPRSSRLPPSWSSATRKAYAPNHDGCVPPRKLILTRSAVPTLTSRVNLTLTIRA